MGREALAGESLNHSSSPSYDVIVVGGGPAGLSAALILGRSRRRVLLFDAGEPRNAASPRLGGFLTRDGIDPLELLRLGRLELRRYGVEIRQEEVVNAAAVPEGFRIEAAGGASFGARKLMLATGVVDRLPPFDGVRDLYGISIHHCPYCDGWEERDRAVAAYGRRRAGIELALKLLTWSADVVLLTDGASRYDDGQRRELRANGVLLREERIARLRGEHGKLHTIEFQDGATLARETLFFTTGQHQRSDLARRLGCTFTRRGQVRTSKLKGTGVPGLYVVGDASRDMQLAVIAAAEGARAAVAMNMELSRERRTEPAPAMSAP